MKACIEEKHINVSIQSETGTVKCEKLADILRFAFRDRTYWCLLIAVASFKVRD